MTRMLDRFILLLCLLLGMTSCHKNAPTIINGMVTDAKTGVAVEGVSINYKYDTDQGGFGYFTGVVKTNINGEFNIKLDPDEHFQYFDDVYKKGYVHKLRVGGTFVGGTINNIKIVMNPFDAVLRMVYTNNSSIENRVYLQAQSKTLLDEYQDLPFILTQPYPFICQPNQKDTLDYPFTSDEQINLYFGFSYYEKVGLAPFRDSLYLNRGDTATYTISF